MKKKPNNQDILHGDIQKALIRMTGPMILGIVSIMLFSLIDAIYVGQLGTKELAAISFTFPVSFIVMSFSMGMAIGLGAVVAQLIGKGRQNEVRRFTTDGLFLAFCIVVFISICGLLTIDPLFSMLGANGETLQLVHEYMNIWYLGVGLLVIPMVGNAAIRATGDTKTPAIIMMIAGGANALFDPFLIFGIGPFPRLELQGAAIATVLSWIVTFVGALWILAKREHMIEFILHPWQDIWKHWKQTLHIGIPASLTNMLNPLTLGILTALIATHGEPAVAAFGAGGRVQPIALVVLMALASIMPAFIGQNWGAEQFNRAFQGLRFSYRFSFYWQFSVAILLALLASPIAHMFSDDVEVIRITMYFLWVFPIGYAFEGIALITSAAFNAIHRPLCAAFLNILRLFFLMIPLAVLGGHFGGVLGIFIGATLGNSIGGIIAYFWGMKSIRQTNNVSRC